MSLRPSRDAGGNRPPAGTISQRSVDAGDVEPGHEYCCVCDKDSPLSNVRQGGCAVDQSIVMATTPCRVATTLLAALSGCVTAEGEAEGAGTVRLDVP